MCILSLDSSTLPSASMTPGKASRAAGMSREHHSVSTIAVPGKSSDGWGFSRQPAVSRDTLGSAPSMLRLPRKNAGRCRRAASGHTSCHSLLQNQDFPILAQHTGEWEEKEKKAGGTNTDLLAPLLPGALFSVHLTKSVNHMTGPSA